MQGCIYTSLVTEDVLINFWLVSTEYSTSDPFMFYRSLPDKHTNALVQNPFRQKKISGVWGHVFGTAE